MLQMLFENYSGYFYMQDEIGRCAQLASQSETIGNICPKMFVRKCLSEKVCQKKFVRKCLF
jgi:hypothetical protein